MKTKMDVHPAAMLFPMLEEDGPELQELAEDIRKNGLRNPILTLDGMIFDGRNRLRACEKAGVKPTFREWKEGGDPFAYAWSLNGERRHLDPIKRAAIRLMVLKNSEEWAKKNADVHRAAEEKRRLAISESVKAQPRAEDGTMLPKPEGTTGKPSTPKSSEGWERNRLAKETGTSPATISRLQKVDRKDPDALKRIAEGKQKLPDALKALKKENVDIGEVNATDFDKERINRLRAVADDLHDKAHRLTSVIRHCREQFHSAPNTKLEQTLKRLDSWLARHTDALVELQQITLLIRPTAVCGACSGSGASENDSCRACEGDGFLTVQTANPTQPSLSS